MTSLLVPRLVVARHLGVDPDRIDPDQPLARYGMDSLRSMELVAALEDATGRALPESFCLDHPTLNRLAGALNGAAVEEAPWAIDAALPDDFVVPRGIDPARVPCNVFLTGATGLVGAFLLRTLIEESAAQVWCLVRAAPGEGLARIKANLERYGVWRDEFARRIEIVRGDLAEPRLGLSTAEYIGVATMTDAVLHAGADVDWVQPYAALRRVNVTGTLEVLRLAAAARPKPVQFLSSLSVCYVPDGPPVIDEATDCLPFVDRLPLGYAQTKCVAEALCREAGARGLPMRVIRPALVAGDSRTGASNVDDLIGRLVRGCIEMRAAPDLDWSLDAVPADELARAVVRTPWPAPSSFDCLHVMSPRPRTWQECVLWINLLGYPCRLLPFADWRARLAADARPPSHPLSPLRSFFGRADQRVSAAELCQSSRHSAPASGRERSGYSEFSALCGMDAAMLASHIDGYVREGVLWSSGQRRPPRAHRPPLQDRRDDLGALLRQHFGGHLVVRSIETIAGDATLGIISDLSAWRRGSHTGITRLRLTVDRDGQTMPLPVVVKARAHEDDAVDAARALAALCGERLERAVERFEAEIGLRGAGDREIAVYQIEDEGLRPFMPACYGTWRQTDCAGSGLVIEDLHDNARLDATSPDEWSDADIEIAIGGLAAIHAAGLERAAHPLFRPMRAPADVQRMAPLWGALAAHAVPLVEASGGLALVARHEALVDTLDVWTPALEASPRTLIHHDFSPRNAAIRRSGDGHRLCAYDWELATIGLPQRDLVEFLCFVLPEDVEPARVSRLVNGYRERAARASGRVSHAGDWREGFRAALSLYLVDRLAFYTMIHRVRPQRFLPRVLRTWQRIDAIASSPSFMESRT